MEYLKIGNIVNTHGIKGELKVKPYTDFIKERYAKGNTVYVLANNQYLSFEIVKSRSDRGFVLVAFKDNEDINLVEKYKTCDIYFDKAKVHALAKGEYYIFQLKGLDAYYNDEKFGVIKEVEEGYQNVFRIETKDKEILVPYVKAFVKNIDLDNNRIDFNLIEGML